MAAAADLTERDRRLLQREQERRSRLINAGKQSLSLAASGYGEEERLEAQEGRRQAARQYEDSLQRQRAATAVAAQILSQQGSQQLPAGATGTRPSSDPGRAAMVEAALNRYQEEKSRRDEVYEAKRRMFLERKSRSNSSGDSFSDNFQEGQGLERAPPAALSHRRSSVTFDDEDHPISQAQPQQQPAASMPSRPINPTPPPEPLTATDIAPITTGPTPPHRRGGSLDGTRRNNATSSSTNYIMAKDDEDSAAAARSFFSPPRDPVRRSPDRDAAKQAKQKQMEYAEALRQQILEKQVKRDKDRMAERGQYQYPVSGKSAMPWADKTMEAAIRQQEESLIRSSNYPVQPGYHYQDRGDPQSYQRQQQGGGEPPSYRESKGRQQRMMVPAAGSNRPAMPLPPREQYEGGMQYYGINAMDEVEEGGQPPPLPAGYSHHGDTRGARYQRDSPEDDYGPALEQQMYETLGQDGAWRRREDGGAEEQARGGSGIIHKGSGPLTKDAYRLELERQIEDKKARERQEKEKERMEAAMSNNIIGGTYQSPQRRVSPPRSPEPYQAQQQRHYYPAPPSNNNTSGGVYGSPSKAVVGQPYDPNHMNQYMSYQAPQKAVEDEETCRAREKKLAYARELRLQMEADKARKEQERLAKKGLVVLDSTTSPSSSMMGIPPQPSSVRYGGPPQGMPLPAAASSGPRQVMMPYYPQPPVPQNPPPGYEIGPLGLPVRKTVQNGSRYQQRVFHQGNPMAPPPPESCNDMVMDGGGGRDGYAMMQPRPPPGLMGRQGPAMTPQPSQLGQSNIGVSFDYTQGPGAYGGGDMDADVMYNNQYAYPPPQAASSTSTTTTWASHAPPLQSEPDQGGLMGKIYGDGNNGGGIFGPHKAPRGQGLKEIQGFAEDAEKKRKMMEHAQLLAQQVEDNARRKAAEKKALEEFEAREAERIQREREQLEAIYQAELEKKRIEEENKEMLSKQIQEKKRMAEEEKKKAAEEERRDQERLAREQEQLRQKYEEEQLNSSRKSSSTQLAASTSPRQPSFGGSQPTGQSTTRTTRESLFEPAGAGAASPPSSFPSTSTSTTRPSIPPLPLGQQGEVPNQDLILGTATTSYDRSYRSQTEPTASYDGRISTRGSIIPTASSYSHNSNANNDTSLHQLQFLEQELQRYQEVVEGLKEETFRARDDAAQARMAHQRIQVEIDRIKSRLHDTPRPMAEGAAPKILDDLEGPSGMWRVPGPEAEMDDSVIPPESLGYLPRAASNMAEALLLSERAHDNMEQVSSNRPRADSLRPARMAWTGGLASSRGPSSLKENMAEFANVGSETLAAETKLVFGNGRVVPADEHGRGKGMYDPALDSARTPSVYDDEPSSLLLASARPPSEPDSFDLQQVMERTKDRYKRLELLDKEGSKAGEELYSFLRRNRQAQDDYTPSFGRDEDDLYANHRPATDRSLHGSVRWVVPKHGRRPVDDLL